MNKKIVYKRKLMNLLFIVVGKSYKNNKWKKIITEEFV